MQNKHSRRTFLKSGGMMLGALSGSTYLTSVGATDDNLKFPLISNNASKLDDPKDIAKDESYWQQVRQFYSVTDDVINLENGY